MFATKYMYIKVHETLHLYFVNTFMYGRTHLVKVLARICHKSYI